MATAMLLVGCLVGCGGPTHVDPASESAVATRTRAHERLDARLADVRAVPVRLIPLSEVAFDECVKGQHNRKVNDPYDSRCGLEVIAAFAFDGEFVARARQLDEALRDLGWRGLRQRLHFGNGESRHGDRKRARCGEGTLAAHRTRRLGIGSMLVRAKRVAVGGLAVLVAGPLAGCQLLGGGPSEGDGNDTAKRSGAGQVPGPNEITASRSGIFHGTGTEGRFKLDIYRVERYGEYSMLRFAVTNLEDTAMAGADVFAVGRLDETFSGFRLLDPVGRRIYYTLRHGGANEAAFGSWAGYDIQLQPNIRYRGVVYFPRLPQNRDRITVLSPSGDTAGEFTGIPVVDGAEKPSVDDSPPPPTPTPGQPAELPAVAPSGDVWSGSDVLYGISDSSSARSNVSSPGKQKVALRADVLFAFDSAKLSDEARTVVQEVAPEITQRADPSKPVIIEGHTDNEGSNSYNQDLSERRANAVHEELTSALDGASSFRFNVSGKGEAEPVADNAHEKGRARNRRVEIEYATKTRAAGSGTVPGPSAAPGSPVIGTPAPFHAKDGPVVATRQASVDRVAASPTDLTLTVHPFYRDGAYLVGVFEVAGGDAFIGGLDTPELIGAGFGAFTVVDPSTNDRYYEVRIGKSDDSIYYVDSGGLNLDGGDSGRHFAYYPAPPAGVETVTFDAGPFGAIKNVPIR